MSAALGLSVEEMNQLVVQFQSAASQLGAARTNVSNHLGSTFWQGPDAENGRRRWDGEMVPKVQAIEARLAEAVQELRIQIDQQIEASRADGTYLGTRLITKDGGGLGYAPPPKKKKKWWQRGLIGAVVGGVGDILEFGEQVARNVVRTVTTNPLSLIGAFVNPVGFLATVAASTFVQEMGITGIAATLLTAGAGIVAGAFTDTSSLATFTQKVATEVTRAVPKLLAGHALTEVGVPAGVTNLVMSAAESKHVKFGWNEISYRGNLGLELGDHSLVEIDARLSPSGLLNDAFDGVSSPSTPVDTSFTYSDIHLSAGDTATGIDIKLSPQATVHHAAEVYLPAELDKLGTKATEAAGTYASKAQTALGEISESLRVPNDHLLAGLANPLADQAKQLGVDTADTIKSLAKDGVELVTKQSKELASSIAAGIDDYFIGSTP